MKMHKWFLTLVLMMGCVRVQLPVRMSVKGHIMDEHAKPIAFKDAQICGQFEVLEVDTVDYRSQIKQKYFCFGKVSSNENGEFLINLNTSILIQGLVSKNFEILGARPYLIFSNKYAVYSMESFNNTNMDTEYEINFVANRSEINVAAVVRDLESRKLTEFQKNRTSTKFLMQNYSSMKALHAVRIANKLSHANRDYFLSSYYLLVSDKISAKDVLVVVNNMSAKSRDQYLLKHLEAMGDRMPSEDYSLLYHAITNENTKAKLR